MTSLETTRIEGEPSIDLLRKIDRTCSEFEAAVGRGELPRIEEIVRKADVQARDQLLRELLTVEMEFRAARGDTPGLDEYRRRLPEDGPLVKYLYLEHFVPTHVGEFSIRRLLGRGGFGIVYEGWDAKLSRRVAIKVFRRGPGQSRARGGGLLVEARMAAQLQHPGIVTVHAVLPDSDDDEFLVLEYVDGKSLEDMLRAERLTPRQAAELLLAVVEALQHAHKQGLVHRDLKPANILIDDAHRPRVTDFGLAVQLVSLQRSPEVAGTLPYMAPEQVSGETHRLDARTDLWAVGVILYRILAGRLPFAGRDAQETLEAIRYAEPEDLVARDPSLSPELGRIIRRCLSKRMSDRYPSAVELADDLRAFLGSTGDLKGSPAAFVAVVPKGLHYFDDGDRDFFLQLVPGPHDRHGVPQQVRFWERQLRQLDASQTFRVGLLYGPSGCGKSSLVRAGILPRLPHHVQSVVIEATREDTELVLIRELRHLFPGLSQDLALPQMLAEVREGPWLRPEEKLLLVFDQFEQWLHGWRQDAVAQLLEALRQCDGGRVQALVLARDDFWMPATRFFQQLDVPLLEGLNCTAVDLFDSAHATKVLAAFGSAYGRLPDDIDQLSFEQRRFLEAAVGELAVDGWTVPVRLCIFAEMIKSRSWTVATLREVGGAHGLGTAFLDEVFGGRMASPAHRLHYTAARAVLERLLPPAGNDIRGHLVTEADLQVATGYEHRQTDFASLLHCLDQDLKLITPSESEVGNPRNIGEDTTAREAPRQYQLTHDFLVAAIRGWLNETRRRTLRGRAQLRLEEYAEAYAARAESRVLPSFGPWLILLLLSRRRSWKPKERLMMRAATRRHAVRGSLVAMALLLLTGIVLDRMAAVHTDGVVEALVTSDSRDLPDIVRRLKDLGWWARPRLARRLEASPTGSDQRLRLLLGSLSLGDSTLDELQQRLLDSDPPLYVAMADILSEYGGLEAAEPALWQVATSASTPRGQRLRACAALAQLPSVSDGAKWQPIADDLTALLLRDVAENPRFFDAWVDGLAPTKAWLVEPLGRSFGDPQRSATEQGIVAQILAHYLADDPLRLANLALGGTPRQLEIMSKTLVRHAPAVRNLLAQAAQVQISEDSPEDEKDRLARRQANAILLLRECGEDGYLWPALRYTPDPRLRSFLIHSLYEFLSHPASFLERLAQEEDVGRRQAIILVVGSRAESVLSPDVTASLVDSLTLIYRDDPDPGVHSAAEWALRRLGGEASLAEPISQLAILGMRPGYRWYVTKSGITMILFAPPGTTWLGSPDTEPGRDTTDEARWTCDVNWSFAVSSTEIWQAKFLEVCGGDPKERFNEHAPDLDCPVNAVTWLEAARFCRLLSERDGVPESEMAMPAADHVMKGPFPDPFTRTGYRLPTEAEWEVACRADTVTPRFFGYATDLLPSYACYIANSQGRSWPVAHGWPNGAGLFDTLGNVSEWCQDFYLVHPELRADRVPGASELTKTMRFAVRGGDYNSNARMARSANRRYHPVTEPAYSRGFRIAHTVPRS